MSLLQGVPQNVIDEAYKGAEQGPLTTGHLSYDPPVSRNRDYSDHVTATSCI